MKTKERGITLIALVVTIIVLLILAGISIQMLTGQSGILNQAGTARDKSGRANVIEDAQRDLLDEMTKQETEVTESILKGILNKYFSNVPDELPDDLSTVILTSRDGKYNDILASEVYQGTFGKTQTEIGEESDDPIYAKIYTDGTLILSSTEYTDTTKVVKKDYGKIPNIRYHINDYNEDGESVLPPWQEEENRISENVKSTKIASVGNINKDYKVALAESPRLYITGVIVKDEIKPISTSGWFDYCVLRYADLRNLNTTNVVDMSYMFNSPNLTELDLSNFKTDNVKNMNSMFSGCSSLKELNLSSFNTSKVIDMSSMFINCRSLTELDLSKFNTSKVTDMSWMFSYCSDLVRLDLNNFKTDNVTDMHNMFFNCNSLVELDLSKFNTSKVTDMSEMFLWCNNLTDLDLSSFNTGKVINVSKMFSRCSILTELDLSKFNTSKVIDMNEMFSYTESIKVIWVGPNWTLYGREESDMFKKCGVQEVTLKNN